MTSNRARAVWGLWWLATVVAGGSCADSAAPSAAIDAPAGIAARALGMHLVRVDWTSAPGVTGYRLERRINLAGPFVTIAPGLAAGPAGAVVSYLDDDVDPETFYGYRVVALGTLGHESGPSLVAGAVTPPHPGIEISTTSDVPVPGSVDPDGYLVSLEGPTSAGGVLGVNDRRRFTPLTAGTYAVTLSGVRSSCEVIDEGPVRSITVTDTGLQTVATAAFQVACRDPARGRIHVRVVTDGDSTDENGFVVTAYGILPDTTLPDSQRVVQLDEDIQLSGGAITFDRLLPGTYEVTLDDVASHCTVAGALVHDVTVTPLSEASLRFDVECRGSGGIGRPYVLRNVWSPRSVAQGQATTVEITLDLTANPAQRVAAVQAALRYDSTVLRFDTATAVDLPLFTAKDSAGVVNWGALITGAGLDSIVTLARVYFITIGDPGSRAGTRTALGIVGDEDANEIDLQLIRIVEDTVTVTAGGSNQPPTAGFTHTCNGLTCGFTSASTDPDGSISSYRWTFGDQTPEVTTPTASHAYAAGGSYTVTLSVTDNQGAADTDQRAVSVTAPGGTTPFTWSGAFGAINADSVVALTLTLDLTADITETSGPEALATFAVDSLKWNPAVLRYHAFNWGAGGAGVVSATHTPQGKLAFSSFTLPTTANSGLIAVATIRFKVIGTPGAFTTTTTHLGPLVGTAATGSYNYRPRTAVTEATFTVP